MNIAVVIEAVSARVAAVQRFSPNGKLHRESGEEYRLFATKSETDTKICGGTILGQLEAG